MVTETAALSVPKAVPVSVSVAPVVPLVGLSAVRVGVRLSLVVKSHALHPAAILSTFTATYRRPKIRILCFWVLKNGSISK